MMEKGKKYLSDILRAIELIEGFTESVADFEAYTSDLKTQSAVERQLGIIGEAVNNFDRLYAAETLQNAKQRWGSIL